MSNKYEVVALVAMTIANCDELDSAEVLLNLFANESLFNDHEIDADELLWQLFTWSRSPEGHGYWANIQKVLEVKKREEAKKKMEEAKKREEEAAKPHLTPALELGYEVGDLFTHSDGCMNNGFFKMIKDDDTDIPLFKLVYGQCSQSDGEIYLDLSEVEKTTLPGGGES